MALPGEPPYVVTLDVGTSSVRARVFDAQGELVPGIEAQASCALQTTPEGGVTIDADGLYKLTTECLTAVRQACKDAPLAGLAMDSFWHSLMGTDGRGRPTTPVITWADTRPAVAARRLRERLSSTEAHARTGCRLHSTYWPAKLRWLADAEPQAFRRTRRWLSFGEYFQWRLTGELACSLSMASATGLLDLRCQTWDQPLLAALGVDASQLSPLVDLDHRLPDGWLPAIGDGVSSNVGSGCSGPTRVAVNVGTSGAMRLLWKTSDVPSVPSALWCYRADRQRLVMGGALSEGGNLWAWLRSTLRLPPVEEHEQALARLEPDAHGLTVLPFIAGERSPGWADGARLTMSGIDMSTRPIDLLRASMEAVAYRFGRIHDELKGGIELVDGASEAMVVASGGAILRSPVWLQILADVLNQPVQALDDREATSRGTALLALESAGVLADLATVRFRWSAVYLPDHTRHTRYREAMDRQQRLYRQVLGTA